MFSVAETMHGTAFRTDMLTERNKIIGNRCVIMKLEDSGEIMEAKQLQREKRL